MGLKMKCVGKDLLITGGAGFIGSHLTEELLKENRVSVLDNFSSGYRSFLDGHLSKHNFELIEADLLDVEAVKDAVLGKDLVFHLAANPDVRLGAKDTHVHLEQNVISTYNLLEAMRENNVKEIAFTSTSTIYGEANVFPTPEDYGPLLPISLYGASKLACEALISSYCHTFEMKSWIYRFANIVGERGTHGVLVDFINKLKDNPRELEILGSGKQRKSYLEVVDCVKAMIFAVENSSQQINVFNIGSNDYVDVTEIANIVVHKMGLKDVSYKYTGGVDGRGWKGDVKVMLLSTEALENLGWKPQHNSRDAIEMAVESLLKQG